MCHEATDLSAQPSTRQSSTTRGRNLVISSAQRFLLHSEARTAANTYTHGATHAAPPQSKRTSRSEALDADGGETHRGEATTLGMDMYTDMTMSMHTEQVATARGMAVGIRTACADDPLRMIHCG